MPSAQMIEHRDEAQAIPRPRGAGEGEIAPPDLELDISFEPGQHAFGQLSFEVTAWRAAWQLPEKRFRPLTLRSSPEEYFRSVFDKISYLGSDGQTDDELDRLCNELSEQLFPEELHQLLWDMQGKAETLVIRSNEMWIPWELLKLRGEEKGLRKRGAFLCEAFAVSRWLAETSWHDRLPMSRLAIVLGDSPDLESLADERKFFADLKARGHEVEFVHPDRDEVLTAMETGSFDVWHFAGHGSWHQGSLNEASLQLAPGISLRPVDIDHDAPNFGQSHPLVFLNACHSGRGDRDLVHWGGWAAALIKDEVGAFLGASWATNDQVACELAHRFYEHFLAGVPLAQALRQARLHVRETYPGDLSWLAYTVFGHPMAVCGKRPQAPLLRCSTTDAQEPAGPSEKTLSIAGEPSRGDRQARRSSTTRSRAGRWRRAARQSTATRPRAGRWRWAGAVGALSLSIFLALVGMRTATRVRLELVADQLAFTVGGEASRVLTDSVVPVHELTVRRFARLELTAAEIDPMDFPGTEQNSAEATGAEHDARVTLVARDVGATARIRPASTRAEPSVAATSLPRLWVAPGSRVLTAMRKEGEVFAFGLDIHPADRLDLPLAAPFELGTSFVTRVDGDLAGIAAGMDADKAETDRVFVGKGRSGSPLLTVFPGADGLLLSATLEGRGLTDIPLLSRGVPIDDLNLLSQDIDGEWRTVMIGQGKITYPDQPWLTPIVVEPDDFLVVDDLETFVLLGMAVDEKTGSLRVTLDGVAGRIRSGPAGRAHDRRLSLYEQWILSHRWGWLAAWVAASLTLIMGLEEAQRRWRSER